MTLDEFNNLTIKDLEVMSTDDIKKLVSEQGKKLNKRISRLSSSKEVVQEALDQHIQGHKFGVKGKNRSQLIDEAIREQRFNSDPLSRYNSAKKEKQTIERMTDKTRKVAQAKAQGKSSKEISNIKGQTQKERVKEYLKKGVKAGKYKLNDKKYKEAKRLATRNVQLEDEGLWEAFKRYREREFQLPYKNGYKDVVAVFSKMEEKYDLSAVANDDELFAKAFEDEIRKKYDLYEAEGNKEYADREKQAKVRPISSVADFKLVEF